MTHTQQENLQYALGFIGETLVSNAKGWSKPVHLYFCAITYRFVNAYDTLSNDDFMSIVDAIEDYTSNIERLCNHQAFDIVEGNDEDGQWWTLVAISDDFTKVIHRTDEHKLAQELKEFFDTNITLMK